MLREAGAAEVHFRVSSPPYRWPCFYGMDTGSRSELLAADMSVGEIRDYLGVDSLAYLELDRLTHATGASPDSFCTACLSGDYPVPVPLDRLQARARGRHRGRARRLRAASMTGPVPERRRGERGDDDPLTYAGAGVDIAAGETGGRADQGSTSARPSGPRSSATSAGSAGCSRSTPRPFEHPLLVSSTDGVGHQVADRPAHRSLRHHRHRPRRDVGRRHRGAGRGAAVLPRLHLDRQARPRDRRRHRRRRRARMRAGGLRAPRRRDVGAPRPDGAGRVRPRGLRGRRRRAGRGPARGRARRATSIVGFASPGLRCNGYSLARTRAARPRRPSARRPRVEGRAPLPRPTS